MEIKKLKKESLLKIFWQQFYKPAEFSLLRNTRKPIPGAGQNNRRQVTRFWMSFYQLLPLLNSTS